jgi:hypothetical protein
MLLKTIFTVPNSLILSALDQLPSDEFRFDINQPTGNFFYDPWEIKPEYQNTPWQHILDSLPSVAGQARLIKLNYSESYIRHADIDDRYHLNLSGNNCYLIDLDNLVMHPTLADGIWYEMDAGRVHTAANFGNRIRYQLVVRKLLIHGIIETPIKVIITHSMDKDEARFLFDGTVSPWLNRMNKAQVLDHFEFKNGVIKFTIEKENLFELLDILPKEFEVTYS